MRIFKNKPFTRFARRAGLSDAVLRGAIEDAERGLVDADLGGGLLKQRIARSGQGKSAGFRSIIVFRSGERAIFVHGFAKNDVGNIPDAELAAFKLLAGHLLAYDEATIAAAVAGGALMEILADG